jgi:hypothetical protein
MSDTARLCLLLQAHAKLLSIRILAAEGTKEYKADWLKNADTVVRDGSGKFAKKGASITQSVKDTTAILKQGFELTGDTIQSLAKDPEFRKRAGLATGLPMAKLISNLATQAKLNPKLTEKLDEWITNATKEFADQYGDDKSPMAQAIRKGNLAQPPKDASFNEKMEFRVAQYAAYKEAMDSPEDFSKRDELIGKAAVAAIPIGVSLAIALGFEVAIPLFMAQGVNWATVLSSVALGEAADFAIQKGMDKLEINDPALRIGASIIAGALAGGISGANAIFKRQGKVLMNQENVVKKLTIDLKDGVDNTGLEKSITKQEDISFPVVTENYLVLVVSHLHEDFLKSLQAKKHIDQKDGENLYSTVQYLGLGSKSKYTETQAHIENYLVKEGSESEYDIYLAFFELSQIDKGLKSGVNQLDRFDAFRKLKDLTVDFKISPRLQMEAYGNLGVFER